jgi:CRP-like cAMP-binding protein
MRPDLRGVWQEGNTVHTLADSKDYVDFLEVVPALSNCERGVLEDFVTYDVVRMHWVGGTAIQPESGHDENLYVLVAGSARLRSSDGIEVDLEPGDYFGGVHPHRELPITVEAASDVEVLVIDPGEIARLTYASCRARHPSKIDQYTQPSTARRSARRNHRRAELASLGR